MIQTGLQVFSHVAPKYPTGNTIERKKNYLYVGLHTTEWNKTFNMEAFKKTQDSTYIL